MFIHQSMIQSGQTIAAFGCNRRNCNFVAVQMLCKYPLEGDVDHNRNVPGMPELPSSLIEFIHLRRQSLQFNRHSRIVMVGQTLFVPLIPERADDIPCHDAVGVVLDETQQEGAVLSQILISELAQGLVVAVDPFVFQEIVFDEQDAVVAMQRTR